MFCITEKGFCLLNPILDKLFPKYLFRFPSQLANFIGKK